MKQIKRPLSWAVLLTGINACVGTHSSVGPVPQPLRDSRELDPFYEQHVDVGGFPILGSGQVTEFAMLEAAWIVEHMLEGREDLLEAMSQDGVHLVVMAYNEYTTDVPEQRDMEPKVFWDRRARGLGGSPVSCAEENLLGFKADPYATENILVHEFAHIIHGSGLNVLDKSFDQRLRESYEQALAAGLWEGTYAATDHREYWAEAVQSWFGDNRENDSLHNHVNTRDELLAYDPRVAALCLEVFGDRSWRYRKPHLREPADRGHLEGLDLDNLPTFRWRDEPIPDSPRVQIDTALGQITVELDYRSAPATVANFLHYVHQGLYSDGSFFRTVREDNQPDNEFKIAVIQASADASQKDRFLPPIPLERTRDTGLKHEDGSISMAREGPDSAQDHFFICVGDQPELDFGGRRNPDGQGFAVFGRVVKGMGLVQGIQGLPAEGQNLAPPVPIQRAVRLD